tara:strand:- start:254 stop:370 length:117 start_codon:yes stop_codon:yes gene_type:complete
MTMVEKMIEDSAKTTHAIFVSNVPLESTGITILSISRK